MGCYSRVIDGLITRSSRVYHGSTTVPGPFQRANEADRRKTRDFSRLWGREGAVGGAPGFPGGGCSRDSPTRFADPIPALDPHP